MAEQEFVLHNESLKSDKLVHELENDELVYVLVFSGDVPQLLFTDDLDHHMHNGHHGVVDVLQIISRLKDSDNIEAGGYFFDRSENKVKFPIQEPIRNTHKRLIQLALKKYGITLSHTDPGNNYFN